MKTMEIKRGVKRGVGRERWVSIGGEEEEVVDRRM